MVNKGQSIDCTIDPESDNISSLLKIQLYINTDVPIIHIKKNINNSFLFICSYTINTGHLK